VQDFRAHLAEQLDFVRSSIERYDAGKGHEAKRLSVPVRTLVHNTRRSTGLLQHLGVQERLGWVDRGPPQPPANAIVISFGVCVVESRFDTGRTRYEPAMGDLAPDRLHPPVSFEDWWRRPILADQHGNTFSRADLVLSVADQDGGAHIDAALNDKYQALSREDSLGLRQSRDLPIANSVVHASIRHIAEELLQTIERGLEWNGHDPVVRNPVCRLPLGTSVGDRNDPCPCGSGRKVKRCYSEREPLRVMDQPPENSKPGQVHPLAGEAVEGPAPKPYPALILDCLMLVPV
jgi:hypothetical protein